MADRDIERTVDHYTASIGPASLAIVGSVAFTHPDDWHRNNLVIHRVIEHLQPEQIISGGAKGIDTLAARIGRELGIDVVEFLPQVRSWADEGGFRDRNARIAETCTHLLRVWCQSSRTYGSGWTADEAQRLGRQVARYSPCFAESGAPGDRQPDLFGAAS